MNVKFNFLKKFFKKKFICPGAFSQVYIYHDGRVFLCPDCFMTKEAEIGNLNDNSFDEIWNSKRAVQIREEILKGKYNYCAPSMCFSKSNYNIRLVPFKDIEYKSVQKSYPKMVCIGADWECNASCIMCRKEICRLSDEELKVCNEKINGIYIPILKDAKTLTVSTTGDPFASRNTRLLIKTAAETYPNLKFNLITNGILCDKYNCDELGITDRILNVMVSIHASNQETYNNVVKNGNWEKVVKNINRLKELKEQKKIQGLYFAFVVNSQNFEDIPNFIEFAKKYNVQALFWNCIDWGGNTETNGESIDIVKPYHSKFPKLVEIIKNTELETPYSHFSIAFQNIKKSVKK